MPYEAILWGVALAAAAGLRLFMPFLFLGVMARYGGVPTPSALEWTATDGGFMLLGVAAVLEVAGDKIPIVDHALDAVATVLKPVAGFVLPAALLYDVSPMAAWTLGIAAGAPLALGVHSTKAGTRALSTATTAGLGNPVISFLEDVLAVVLLVLTALAPVLAAAVVILLVMAVVKAVQAWRGRRPGPSGTARAGP